MIDRQALARTHEYRRLAEDGAAWRRWGPYLSERAWGTVREDYSPDGEAWRYLPHDHARSRAYRWNEDGLAGICDEKGLLCFATALWNGRDAILKERLFGLSGPQGNHGEDVKELYYYLDSTPTHSYLRYLYMYPQATFPYDRLVRENAQRSRDQGEFELVDAGVFAEGRYFEICLEYAKSAADDILIQITSTNRGPEEAELHLLPTLWFRNTWSWGRDPRKPQLSQPSPTGRRRKEHSSVWATHHELGDYALYFDDPAELLFTENETNVQRLFGVPNPGPHVKDAFHAYVVGGDRSAVNPLLRGTKAAPYYRMNLPPGEAVRTRLRLTLTPEAGQNAPAPFSDFSDLIERRQQEADEFYSALQSASLPEDVRLVQRQAFAGLLWSKQFYHYDVAQWLEGDPGQPAPPAHRKNGRNRDWTHLNNADVLSMPDKWEYPWFAAWDLAFHCIPLAMVDPEFAKRQLLLLGREWYQHPNGQIPAYEWNFSDVNPPVLAWAAQRVYAIDRDLSGRADHAFLERVFHKLMLYFTWWVNRKDSQGKNVFQGGFLGLDNIGIFDRSAPLPAGGTIEQSDGTSWMGMYCLNMMSIALELARSNPVYEDIATKFFEHFLYIAAAMNNIAGEGISLWDDEDEFFYDVLSLPDGRRLPLKVRSMVGLIPLFAVETLEPEVLDRLPDFRRRLEWFLENRPQLAGLVSRWQEPGMGERRLMALVRGHRMKALLRRALDPAEFLSDYGVRSLSKVHEAAPYTLDLGGVPYGVRYEPAESRSPLFGGNSNWRGPVWFPVNFMLIESLRQYHRYYGDDFRVECPSGSGQRMTLEEIAGELARRLVRLFLRDQHGRRPVFGPAEQSPMDPLWGDHPLFYEYFHGDSGAGLGASHQTGWTGLVATLIQEYAGRGLW